MRPWSKFPTWWYRQPEGGLPLLVGGTNAGTSQAALRVLLALGAADRPADSFISDVSLSNLEDLTTLSRSMVVKGIQGAVAHRLISYDAGRQGTKSRFELLRTDNDHLGGWAKLPIEPVRTRIPRITHRGDVALAALKIYLTLIAARPNNNSVVSLRHDTLRLKTGCQTRHVRSAISLLANEGLLHVVQEEDVGDVSGHYRAQRYAITGRLEAPRRWNEEPND
jgi:hypothetical protein